MGKKYYPIRDTMPYFVATLRHVDEWKYQQAKRSSVNIEMEREMNTKGMKPQDARSVNVDDLIHFLNDTMVDINLMVQLPSIEKCLHSYWQLYGIPSSDNVLRIHSTPTLLPLNPLHHHGRIQSSPLVNPQSYRIGHDMIRQFYYDLAYALVQAKTETIHKNTVALILRSAWTHWEPSDPPLDQLEFYRLIFILAHLMTQSTRLSEYLQFLQDTIIKIHHIYQVKAKRNEARKSQVKVKRKSSMMEIMNRSSLLIETKQMTVDKEQETSERFVEILARGNRNHTSPTFGTAQHVIEDTMLHDKMFQDKWKHSTTIDLKTSMDAIMRDRNPVTTQYFPPLFIVPLRTTSRSKGLEKNQSTPVLQTNSFLLEESKPFDEKALNAALHAIHRRDPSHKEQEEVLRRSLSSVKLRKRMEANNSQKSHTESTTGVGNPIYLAISTEYKNES